MHVSFTKKKKKKRIGYYSRTSLINDIKRSGIEFHGKGKQYNKITRPTVAGKSVPIHFQTEIVNTILFYKVHTRMRTVTKTYWFQRRYSV